MVIDQHRHFSSILSILLFLTQTEPLGATPLFHAQTPKLDKRVVPSRDNKLKAHVAVSVSKPKDAANPDDLRAKKKNERQAATAAPSSKAPIAEPAKTTSAGTTAKPTAAPAEAHIVDAKTGTGKNATAWGRNETPSILATNVDSPAMRALTANAEAEMQKAAASESHLTAGTDFSFAKMFNWLNAHTDNHHPRLNGGSDANRGMSYEELVTSYGITGLQICSDAKHYHQMVTRVFPTTPASSSDIQPGDVLLMANDHLFYGNEGQVEVWRIITGPPNTKVDMVFSRQGCKYKVTLNRMNIEAIRDPQSRYYFQRCFHRLGALNTSGS